jgi:hypothetical protein
MDVSRLSRSSPNTVQEYFKEKAHFLLFALSLLHLDMHQSGPLRDGKMKGYLLSFNTNYEVGYVLNHMRTKEKNQAKPRKNKLCRFRINYIYKKKYNLFLSMKKK